MMGIMNLTSFTPFGADIDHAPPHDRIPFTVLEEAAEKQRLKESRFVAFTGKMGAGKDTVGQATADVLFPDGFHASFATALKEEVQQMINIITENSDASREALIDTITVHFEEAGDPVTADHAAFVIDQLRPSIRERGTVSSYDRYPEMRVVLQNWGTEVRRTQNPDYWVEKLLVLAVGMLATGRSVYVTDARFPNEVEAVRRVGGYAIRLNVSRDVQIERLTQRDGKRPDVTSFEHPSETSLDGYVDFDVVIDTDTQGVDSIVAMVQEQLR